jgi:hypothetical protein
MVDLTKQPKPDAALPLPETKKQQKGSYDRQCKAFFLTLNNPLDYGYSHEHITEIIHDKFKHILYWCMCDEQGLNTQTYHTHIYILLSQKKRWSAVQNAFPHAHIDICKGSPQECRAYIRKEGQKYKDKAETNFPDTFFEEGSIPDFVLTSDRMEMLQQIDEMLAAGLRPSQILEKSVAFRQYEAITRKHYLAKRVKETPPLREVRVRYHIGKSGSGKSFSYTQLCEEFGDDNVFFASDFSNKCTALLDGYEAEEFLFVDEVKPDSFTYGYMLQLLQGYKSPIHARYSNVYSLWKQIDITSIYPPDELYDHMVDLSNRSRDSKQQLLRRITSYVYHYKTDDGKYHSYEIPASNYVSYDALCRQAENNTDEFEDISDSETPF